MTGLVQIILLMLILIMAAAFAALNEQVISMNYFIGTVDTPLTFVIIICFILGMLFSFLIIVSYLIRQRLQQRRLKQALKLKDQELNNLRAMPVKDSI